MSFAAPEVSARVGELLETARSFVARFEADVRRDVPPGTQLFDAHVHVGRDVDGMVGDFDELSATLDRYGVSRAFAFCLDEPDREPAFRAGNDRTLEFAARSAGRLVPFARLDLEDDPVAEARRCFERGARGIKLHPRAQVFALDDARLEPVFALAAEWRVPILIHGGHGLPPIAEHLLQLVDAHPGAQLIIAHAGVADLANLARRFAGRPGVYFDTSVWSALDLLDLFNRVPPEQILYASDYPYGQQPSSLSIACRVLALIGAGDDVRRAVLGENAARIADGRAPSGPTAPIGRASLVQPVVLARIHEYLSMAAPQLWRQRKDSRGVLDLAVAACEDDGLERLAEMIATARALWHAVPELESGCDKRTAARSVFQLIQLADIVAVTTSAP